MRRVVLMLVVLSILMPVQAFALMPPMSPKELKNASNLIVIGSIIDVSCTGKEERTPCVKFTEYKAKLKVEKVIKGKPASEVDLYFNLCEVANDCDTTDSPDTVHYKGESGKYYLYCEDARCRLVDWNGIEYKTKGEKNLPKC